jgi:protein-S-isoprenylcysteine O-methyltransferase
MSMAASVSMLGTLLGASELALALFKRSRTTESTTDRYSLLLLWTVILASITVAVVTAPAATPSRAAVLCGWALFVSGACLRWYSIYHLGRFFTVDVQVGADHELVANGPYRFIRHPSYTGMLLEFSGFALCFDSWTSFLIITVPIMAAFLYRISIEESALESVLGERYVSYRAHTRRLIPFLY